jgi:hypothetical protein
MRLEDDGRVSRSVDLDHHIDTTLDKDSGAAINDGFRINETFNSPQQRRTQYH